MLTLRSHIKPISSLMILCFGFLVIMAAPLKAELVTTKQVLNQTQADSNRIKVRAFFERADAQHQLEKMGIDARVAKTRVDNLTDEEVAQLAQQIDELPAGGGMGTVFVAAAVVFLVLLFTDLMGWTDIFPFVKKR